MIFSVGDQWRIDSNEYGWLVQRYAGVFRSGPRINEPKWETKKHCTELAHATKLLGGLMIRDANTTNEKQALAAIERVAAAIEAAGL